MKKIVIIFAIPLLFLSCSGQGQQKDLNNKAQSNIEKNEPRAEIKVNKIYDDEGNMVRYDSTYVWSYSNVAGDSVFVDVDSVMSRFQPFMDAKNRFYFPFFHTEPFIQDSIFYYDFLDNDYFMHRWENSMESMTDMMREMDSLKSQFFRENYPALKQPDTIW